MLKTTNITPEIGSEIALDAESMLAGTYKDEILKLLEARGVLLFRNIKFDEEQVRTFTATLGERRLGAPMEEDGLLKVINIPGSFFWHIDGLYSDLPPFATVLTPQVLPKEGGDTEFANMYAAFEDLPEDEKEYLSTLEVACTMQAATYHTLTEITPQHLEMWKENRRVQPLVWRHKSGRRSLVLGQTVSHVIGMHHADSYELLQRLLAHATQDKYVLRHQWKMGDVVMWDNTGTMHRARSFDPASGRCMLRCTLEGIEPLSLPSQRSAA